MNDFFVLLEFASDLGRWALVALFVVAVGLLLFDRRARGSHIKLVRRSRDQAA